MQHAQPAELLINVSIKVRDFFSLMNFSRSIASVFVEYVS
jgi:hypothetical protein